MQIESDTDVSLFVRDRVTGRLVFNSKAIEALRLDRRARARRRGDRIASPFVAVRMVANGTFLPFAALHHHGSCWR